MLALMAFGMGLFLAGCGSRSTLSDDIVTVQERYEPELMSLPGVVGVGIGECDGQPCLKVFVMQKTPALESQIPAQLEGFKVEIEAVGSFNIFAE